MKKYFLAAFLFIFILPAFFSNVKAATFVVTNTGDSNAVGSGSLRRAILDASAANTNDIIEFDPVVFATPQTITLINSGLTITNFNFNDLGSLTINGRNVVTVTRSSAGGTPQFGIFRIENAAIINNLT